MKPNITTVTVCRYVLENKSISSRAVARALGIHHRTWQRYLNGEHRPDREIKYRIIRFMDASSFEELVNQAFHHFSIERKTSGDPPRRLNNSAEGFI